MMPLPVNAAEFDRLLAPLGPFEPQPKLAVAVSGGADSLALCLLAHDWARAGGGAVTALVCDHGLRDGSGQEAAEVAGRLRARGMAAQVLRLEIDGATRIAERARNARYAALQAWCAAAGILHLLVGHHAGDQAETIAMRLLRGSGPDGLAGMAALVEGRHARLLRPLLTVAPVRLRATLAAFGAAWVEDPTNDDLRYQRARVRQLRRDRDGAGPAVTAACHAATARGERRQRRGREQAGSLAAAVCLHPAGFALVGPELLTAEALAALVQTLAGADWPPPLAQVAAWLAAPRAATLGGLQVRLAGRLRPGGWLLAREMAAIGAAVAMRPGAVWDRRFRLQGPVVGECAALGAEAAGYRRLSRFPAAILRALPAIRLGGVVLAVPHLRVGDAAFGALFCPGMALTQEFWPSRQNPPDAGMHKASWTPILTSA